MKIKFPKIGSFLLKADGQIDSNKKVLNVSKAFVFQGHIVAINAKTALFINLKEYLKYSLSMEDDDDPKEVFSLVSKITEKLEGRTLSKEFFNIFSKMQTISEVDDERIFVENNGLHSEFILEPEYDINLLSEYLTKIKTQWSIERSEQASLGVNGAIMNSLSSVLKTELNNDTMVFERTTDDKMKFCFLDKDFIFGITEFPLESESSLTKFGEGQEFFDTKF